MDDETRETMERWFGLLHQEVTGLRGELVGTRQEMREGFARVDERFAEVDARFAGVDARFAGVDARFGSVDERFASLHHEMRERAESMDEQFRTLTIRMQHFEGRIEATLAVLSADVTTLKDHTGVLSIRMKGVEIGIGDLNARVDTLAEDMRQRFRVYTGGFRQ